MSTSMTSPNSGDQLSAAGFGDKVAAVVNGFQATGVAVSSGAPALTTSYADITGATKTIIITGANAFAVVIGTIAWTCTTLAAAEFFQGALVVDGAGQDANGSILQSTVGTFNFRPSSQTWVVPLTAGSHTLKLQAKKSGATSVGATSNPHCTLTVIVFDLP